MFLDIITPDNTIFSGEISSVRVPGASGSFEILENHAPLVSALDKGQARIRTSQGKEIYYIMEGGVIEVNNNKVIVLAESVKEGQLAI